MKVKLFSTPIVTIQKMPAGEAAALFNAGKVRKVLSPSTFGDGLATVYVPIAKNDQHEDLLGEFDAIEFQPPNPRLPKMILVETPRGDIKLGYDTLTSETSVNIFRVEVKDE